jgi:hypothetical protein
VLTNLAPLLGQTREEALSCGAKLKPRELSLWHRRLGHLGIRNVLRRWNGILRGDRETRQYETGGKAILDRIEADQSPYIRVRESRHLSLGK